jgi:hypothetical protein
MEKEIQIYFVDANPKLAAQALVNEHLSPQIMVCVRLLCNAHRILDGIKYVLYDEREPCFYKVKQIKNPWSKWCRESVQNYLWISDYLFALLDEYKIRFNKKHRILSFRKNEVGIPFLLQSPPHRLKEYEWTNPPLTIPAEYVYLYRDSIKYKFENYLIDIVNINRYFYKLSMQYFKPYEEGAHYNHPSWLQDHRQFQKIINGND